MTKTVVIHMRLHLEVMQLSEKGRSIPLIKASEVSIKLWSKILKNHWENGLSWWWQWTSNCKDTGHDLWVSQGSDLLLFKQGNTF